MIIIKLKRMKRCSIRVGGAVVAVDINEDQKYVRLLFVRELTC